MKISSLHAGQFFFFIPIEVKIGLWFNVYSFEVRVLFVVNRVLFTLKLFSLISFFFPYFDLFYTYETGSLPNTHTPRICEWNNFYYGISPNVITITVHFIRPIRDLALCERRRDFFPFHQPILSFWLIFFFLVLSVGKTRKEISRFSSCCCVQVCSRMHLRLLAKRDLIFFFIYIFPCDWKSDSSDRLNRKKNRKIKNRFQKWWIKVLKQLMHLHISTQDMSFRRNSHFLNFYIIRRIRQF